MNVNPYLDSTYLKTAEQAGISEKETEQIVVDLVNEAIENNFKLVMIRSNFVPMARKMITDAGATVVVGTVIGFHEGTASVERKLEEAHNAIDAGVDELDYVVNYTAFKNGQINLVKSEVFKGTKIGLDHQKMVKWIIEIAALTEEEVIGLTQLIRDVVVDNFSEEEAKQVFVKSSTGFYKREDGGAVGATFEGMELIVENAKPLQAKAAGGVKSYEDAIRMLEMGVTRIGTSSAKKIADGKATSGEY